MGASFEFSLPPLSALAFVPFIFLQAFLLQPLIPARISRVLRLLLMVPALYYASIAPFKHRIEPASLAIGANFRWGIFGPNFIMKALEWGLANDRSTFKWIGFGPDKPTSNETIYLKDPPKPPSIKAAASSIARGSNGELKKRRSLTRNDTSDSSSQLPTPPESPRAFVPDDLGIAGPVAFKFSSLSPIDKGKTIIESVLDALHLCTAMRGIGYSFGPPIESLAGRQGPPPPLSHPAFAKRALWRFFRSHLVSTTCLILIIHRNDLVPQSLHRWLFLTPVMANTLSLLLAYLSVGFSLHAQMLIGFEGASLAFLAMHYLPKPLQVQFDAREWPPLFDRPFDMTCITTFWGKQWHALFRKPFTSIGYEPINAVCKKVLGRRTGKQLGRMFGAMMVFGMSAWLHDQGFFSARHGLPSSTIQPLSFLQRHGANLFFLLQSVCVILESLFKTVTGRKVGGIWGRVWSLTMIAGCGALLAGRSWIALGLVDGLPGIQHWDWERWILPTVNMAPPPLWIK